MFRYLIKGKNGKQVYKEDNSPQDALKKYLKEQGYQILKMVKVSDSKNGDFYVKRKGGADNYYKVNILPNVIKREVIPMSITVDGKPYEIKRYTYEELYKLFYGKTVILKDCTYDYSDLKDGVLVGVCNPEDEDAISIENLKQGKIYDYWYMGASEIVTPYLGV